MANRARNRRDAETDENLQEAYHGSIDYREMRRYGIDPEQVIDFSANINPFGPSPRVRQAVCKCVLDRYPDRQSLQLRETISAHHAVAIDRIAVGNGSSELLQSLAQLFLQPGDEALIVGPTYGEYARASRLAGARVEHCRATAECGFAVPVKAIEIALQRQPKVAFLCNPNNPTGQGIDHELILAWIASHRETKFIIDESYIDFVVSPASVIRADYPNLNVLRSMTKSYALAGLRLGYAVADPDVIQQLCQRRVPWNVSAVAQAAGIAAIEDQAYLQNCLTRLREAKRELLQGLASRQFDTVASAANFFLIRVGDAAVARQRLLSHHLLVRDCASFGIPDHIRIAVRTPEQNGQLIAAL